jgi:hypothetical protein
MPSDRTSCSRALQLGSWTLAFRPGATNYGGSVEHIAATLEHRDRSVRMADNDSPAEADETVDNDEPEEAEEESFPASDPPATWSGPEE